MLKLQKTILIGALALTGMTSTTAFAEVTANAAATSNYLWRGQEQTGGDAAVSGGIDYANESGFYAGTWASNASWADEMTYELDLYAGFGGAINENVSYDVGYIYYAYPDAASGADADFSEVYGSISVQGFTFGAAVLATSAASGDGTDFGDDNIIDYGVSVSKDGFTFGLSDNDMDGSDVKAYVAYAVDFSL